MSNPTDGWSDSETLLWIVTLGWDEEQVNEALTKALGGEVTLEIKTSAWSEIQRLRAQWNEGQEPMFEQFKAQVMARLFRLFSSRRQASKLS